MLNYDGAIKEVDTLLKEAHNVSTKKALNKVKELLITERNKEMPTLEVCTQCACETRQGVRINGEIVCQECAEKSNEKYEYEPLATR